MGKDKAWPYSAMRCNVFIMKKTLTIIALLHIAVICYALQFTQVASLPVGHNTNYGKINVFDSNHDGYTELTFVVSYPSPDYIPVYEYSPVNHYNLSDTILHSLNCFPWAIGYMHPDSLTSMLICGQTQDTINIFQSRTYYSYPDTLVKSFRTSFSTNFTIPYYLTDLDRDGLKEITTYSHNDSLLIYENTGGDDFSLVFQTLIVPYASAYYFAIGDADKDEKTEFITGGSSGRIIIYKCIGDNDYQIKWLDTTRISRNSYDPVFVTDMDGNGLPQFIMGSSHNPGNNTWTAVWKFYEADTTVPDSFKVVYVDSLQNITTWPDYESSSSCGDIDGDGIPEAVLAVSNNWLVYKGNGPGQFQRIYKAYTSGNSRANTSVCVADMNGNGYAEVIEGGAINSTTSETRIWEVMGEVAWGAYSAITQDSCIQVGWSTTKQFASYGFKVLRSTALAGPYALIHETNDTIRLDSTLLNYTYNDSNVTTGTRYYYKVRAMLLNDTNYIVGPDSALGVAGRPELRIANYDFGMSQNRPNPFERSTIISYQIPKSEMVNLQVYNVAGQLVKTLVNTAQEPGAYHVEWNGQDKSGKLVSNGIYFYCLRSGGQELSRRMIVVR